MNNRLTEECLRSRYIYSISRYNILPVTSRCNFSCLFCSHRQNPPGIEVIMPPDLDPGRAEELMFLLDPARPIVIGEAATRCLEGEPFCNPHLLNILCRIREKFPRTLIHLATNGSFLKGDVLEHLGRLMPVELQISVNCLDPETRKCLHGSRGGNRLSEAFVCLAERGIPFSTSLVALPGLTGYETLRTTIHQISCTASEIIKLYWFSTTRFAPSHISSCQGNLEELGRFAELIKGEISTPLLYEPPLLEDLTPVTEGCIRGSPGERAGIQPGDEIISVNGYEPWSRVEAYRKIKACSGTMELVIKRRSGTIRVNPGCAPGERAGITFLYDFDYEMLHDIRGALEREKDSLIVTSELALKVLSCCLKREGIKTPLRAVKNKFFGGTTGCAGLLTVDDMISEIKDAGHFSQVLIPSSPFDERGLDLVGRSWQDITDATGAKVAVI